MATSSQIPVRCVVKGNVYDVVNGMRSQTPRSFNHTYEFSEFRSAIDPDNDNDAYKVFEVNQLIKS